MRFPWGKFRGWYVNDVPTSYLCWAYEEADLSPLLATAVKVELRRRFVEAGPPSEGRPDLRDAVGRWYRKMSLRFHPDRGGTDRDMAVINEAREELCRSLGLPT